MFFSQNHKEKFSNKSIKKITHYNKKNEKHGEERSWWDKHHRLPKTYSIYKKGELIQTTLWYQSGQIQYNMSINNGKKIEVAYYNNGIPKFTKKYVFLNNIWLRSGLWLGFYINSNIKYKENYNSGNLENDCYYYYYDGNLKRIVSYKNGGIVNETSFPNKKYFENDLEDYINTEKIFNELDFNNSFVVDDKCIIKDI